MRLPSLKPRDVVKVLKRVGFEEQRQTGSHLIMMHREKRRGKNKRGKADADERERIRLDAAADERDGFEARKGA